MRFCNFLKKSFRFFAISLFVFCLFIFWISNSNALAQGGQDFSSLPDDIATNMVRAEEQEKLGNLKETTRYLNQIASIYWEQKNYPKAIEFYEKSINFNQKLSNETGIYALYSNLAMIYADIQDYPKSAEYFQKTLVGRKKYKDKVAIISAQINLSVVLNNLKRYQESIEQLEGALTNSITIKDTKQMNSCYLMLAEVYDKIGNEKKYREYLDLYNVFRTQALKESEVKMSRMNEKIKLQSKENEILESKKKIQELELQNKALALNQKEQELEKSETEKLSLLEKMTKSELLVQYLKQDSIRKAKENEWKAFKIKKINEENESQRKQQALIRNALIIGGILLLIILAILAMRYQEKQKSNKMLLLKNTEIMEAQKEIIIQKDYIWEQNHKLEFAFDEIKEKNKDITDSIQYASYIQKAMLPSISEIQSVFADSFVLFQPRDVVSGDFYWFFQKDELAIMAAVDCTGHGVPGAFMSMIGDSLLKQVVKDKKIYEAGLILKTIHEGVTIQLQQDTTANRDGMDIALVVWNKKTKILQFAGAHNPLFYIKDGVVGEIKGDKKGIGGYTKVMKTLESEFESHNIDLNNAKECTFYLYSDGYQDQFGGAENRKFMSRKFKDLLLSIHTLPFDQQKIMLKNIFEEWKGTENQMDDVLVMGAKIVV